MVLALALGAYAALVGTLGAYAMRRSRWPERAPRLGILAWQALSGSVIVSVVLAGMSVALPVWTHELHLAELLDTCVVLLRTQYATIGGAAVSSLGIAVAALVLGRTTYSFGCTAWRQRARRTTQRQRLALVARRHPELDAMVLDHRACAAYCVPGRNRLVVVTTATLETLDDAQLAAVLQHERAHLRGRHHLVIQAAAALRAAFPFVPTFVWAEREVARLAEMLADDAAARHADGLTLATALVRLADGVAPAGALGAGGAAAIARVRRLATPAAPLGRLRALAALAGTVVIVLTPIALAVSPALAAMGSEYCPIVFPA